VKPPDFAYHRPRDVDEAVSLLAEHAPDVKVLAGGQSLMPMLNMRLLSPAHLVDINFADGFPGVAVREGTVEVGALVRQRELEADQHVARACPLLAQALRHVGHKPIRSRGTVVGSVAHADPAAELPAVLALLDGSVVARGPGGEREIPAAEFFRGWFETALAPDELATAVRFRGLAAGERSAFVEMARRSGDFALCGAAAVVNATRATVALTGVGPVPHVQDVSGLLSGDGEAALDELAGRLRPEADIHASADFRRHLARELAKRVVAAARGDSPDGGG
jgi:aerobic carbon-monoxide dehydrogenase medium subunit